MKQFGLKFKKKDGWTLVTGSKAQMDVILTALRGTTRFSDKERHSPPVLIGNDALRRWRSTHALAPVDSLARAVTTW